MISRDVIRDTLLSEVFLISQPNRGDVFSWLDDNAEYLAAAIGKAVDTEFEKDFAGLRGSVEAAWRLNAAQSHEIQRLRTYLAALAAAASGGDVKQAPAESPQSGGESRNAQPQASHKYSMKEEPNG